MTTLSPEEALLFKEVIGRSPENGLRKERPPVEPLHPPTSPPPITSPSDNGLRKYFTLSEAFPNAASFLMFFDSSLRSGQKMLYPWQIEELLRLSNISKWKTDSRLLYYLLANNGSGKDAFIIAGIVVYVLCCFKRYKIIITSSSDNQLDTQTRVYIRDLAENVNNYMRSVWGWQVDAIEIKAESFKATPGFSGTEVYTFVSKVGGKVEGYHPFPDAPPGEGVVVIVNEGKSIDEEIHRHLKKCTYNVWIEVSSAGEASGTFYKATTNAIQYPAEPQPFRPFCRTITYRDTPHKHREAEEAIKEDGENDPFVKNTYLSKFSSVGQQVAITEELLELSKSCREKIVIGSGRHGGVDFAAGGDECSFYAWDENTLIGYESWRVKDTERTIELLVGDTETSGFFKKYGFTKEMALRITGDDNGLGEPIINRLHALGWTISRIKNQQSARRKDKYLNRGAELYNSFARLIELNVINWNGKLHPKLFRQLCTRHYTIEGAGKYKLIDKKDEPESPDHADAVILAWSQWTALDFLDEKVKRKITVRTPAPSMTTQELLKSTYHHNIKWQLEGIVKPASTASSSRFNNPITALRSIYDN